MKIASPRMTAACVVGLAIVGAGLVAAQDAAAPAPFRVPDEARFQGGETWRVRNEVHTTRTRVGREGEEEVTTIVWTETSDVLDRPHGFALRSTLTSWRMRATGPRSETTVEYGDEDLRTIEVGRDGREVELARTWTYEFDPSWRLLDVSGQRRTLKQLYMKAARDMTGDGGRCGLRAWIVRRMGPFVVDRWSAAVEEALLRMNREGLAPVRVVAEHLRGGGEVGPGFEARLRPAGDLPGGRVRYVRRGEAGAEFRVEFDVQRADVPVPEYAFAIDDAGRLAWLDLVVTRVVDRDGDAARVTTRVSYVLEEVTRTPQRTGEPGLDTGDAEGRQDDEGRPRRAY